MGPQQLRDWVKAVLVESTFLMTHCLLKVHGRQIQATNDVKKSKFWQKQIFRATNIFFKQTVEKRLGKNIGNYEEFPCVYPAKSIQRFRNTTQYNAVDLIGI